MAGPVLYSTNPWFAHEVAMRYRAGVHFAWVSDYFDAHSAPAAGAAGAIAPSSNPKEIYHRLSADIQQEDTHSALISGYKKTFKRLAKIWEADGSITGAQSAEIVSVVKSNSWNVWRPVLYVIPRALIVPTERIKSVPRRDRAAYGPELQIADLKPHEFDMIELKR